MVSWESSSVGAAPRSFEAHDPAPQPSRVSPALVGDRNYSCEPASSRRRGREVVRGEAKTTRASK
jgi:hypothetical protein